MRNVNQRLIVFNMHSGYFNNIIKCWAFNWIWVPALKHQFVPISTDKTYEYLRGKMPGKNCGKRFADLNKLIK